ncbi:prolyl-tRNA synthetase associated domain-containing protein [Burkholderia anthina]|uniref:prolyl-tRNA synthetase associated domain-containing protein n=1 Tax=Burkholderia anthina TaxID=179879 RepID=UPI001AA081AF|nr:prolyl-tRNA synthetase associated domain-containing protein [Burkholderia anthina]QTD94993.1 prolyl-tRNA synthetase associated domain-containing protein [Burkholderia anthina]
MEVDASMSGKNKVLGFLEARKIPFECEEHDAVLNMAESGLLSLSVVGARCKNLLLQDKKGHDFLVVTTVAKALDLVALSETLGSKRLSFVSADRLFELLGIRTGSLSPLALVNDEARQVRLVIDEELASEDAFLFHPLDNSASVLLTRSALDTFLASVDHPADWLPLRARQPD